MYDLDADGEESITMACSFHMGLNSDPSHRLFDGRFEMKPLRCGHSEEYRCVICRNCCQCNHLYAVRAAGDWWAKCKSLFTWHKCLGPGKSSGRPVTGCGSVPCPICTETDYEVKNAPDIAA